VTVSFIEVIKTCGSTRVTLIIN